jgi:hypothetical protein
LHVLPNEKGQTCRGWQKVLGALYNLTAYLSLVLLMSTEKLAAAAAAAVATL